MLEAHPDKITVPVYFAGLKSKPTKDKDMIEIEMGMSIHLDAQSEETQDIIGRLALLPVKGLLIVEIGAQQFDLFSAARSARERAAQEQRPLIEDIDPDLLDRARSLVAASDGDPLTTGLLQRHLRIGYPLAVRIMDKLAADSDVPAAVYSPPVDLDGEDEPDEDLPLEEREPVAAEA